MSSPGPPRGGKGATGAICPWPQALWSPKVLQKSIKLPCYTYRYKITLLYLSIKLPCYILLRAHKKLWAALVFTIDKKAIAMCTLFKLFCTSTKMQRQLVNLHVIRP